MHTEEWVRSKREEILRIAAEHGATNIRIFGSVGRGEATGGSDVDFLVDMKPRRSLLDLVGLQLDLEDLLDRKVDVLTENSIYWLIRRRILREARPL